MHQTYRTGMTRNSKYSSYRELITGNESASSRGGQFIQSLAEEPLLSLGGGEDEGTLVALPSLVDSALVLQEGCPCGVEVWVGVEGGEGVHDREGPRSIARHGDGHRLVEANGLGICMSS